MTDSKQTEDGAIDGEKDESLLEENQSLKAELKAANEECLRAKADLENYRKRSRKEFDEQIRFSHIPLVQDLLPVIDNLQRAIESGEKTEDAQGLLEGVKMVAQQLNSTLQQHHCKVVEAKGLPFDPNYHEAVMQQTSDKHEDMTVLSEIQSGYQLHDRVVRPAKVIVSRKEKS